MKQRSISDNFMDKLLSEYKTLIEYVKSDNTLDLEMRGDKVIVYYRGGKILTLNETGVLSPLDEKYGKGLMIDWKSLEDYIPKAKHLMDIYQTNIKANLGEKEISQRIAQENNYSPYSNDTDYFIADLEFEYLKRDNKKNQFDLIGIKWLSKGAARKKLIFKLAVIETKQGISSLRTSESNPGLKRHYEDYVQFTKGVDFEAIGNDIAKIFCQKCELGLVKMSKRSKPITRKSEFIVEPEAEFIAVLANYKRASENLKNELDEIPEGADIKFATTNYMGYGLFEDSIISLDKVKDNVKK